MRYSLVTPTILRDSLVRLCQTIDAQSCKDWEHIVIVDGVEDSHGVLNRIQHSQRQIRFCGRPHRNFGSTCRHEAFPEISGELVWYLDDDNYLADDNVLRDLGFVTGQWALFPILRYGERFLNDPPGVDRTDTGNFILRREIAQWPNADAYNTDSKFAADLAAKYPYQMLSAMRPLLVMPASNHGRFEI